VILQAFFCWISHLWTKEREKKKSRERGPGLEWKAGENHKGDARGCTKPSTPAGVEQDFSMSGKPPKGRSWVLKRGEQG